MAKKTKSANKRGRKILVSTMAIIGVILVGLLSVSYASAQDSGGYSPIVQKLAERFNLNEADVQAVFDDEREEHYADMQARWTERLDDLVNEGKITSGQKQAILDKYQEMHDKMQELKDLTQEERKQKTRELQEDFRVWAKQEGLDLPFFGPFGKGLRHGFRARHMVGVN